MATELQHERRARDTAAPLIELDDVEKVYRTGKLEYRALRGVDLVIDDGDMVAIVRPSGSGKRINRRVAQLKPGDALRYAG